MKPENLLIPARTPGTRVAVTPTLPVVHRASSSTSSSSSTRRARAEGASTSLTVA